MKLVPLEGKNKGQFFMVDDEDYERVIKYKWWARKGNYIFSREYDYVLKKGKHFSIHRYILNLIDKDSNIHVDHKDHNRFNNQKSNLRICNNQQNTWNGKSRKGTSKYKGVSYEKRVQKWRVVIMKDTKQVHIGTFTSEEEAALAYNKKAIELFGEFAYLNKVGEARNG